MTLNITGAVIKCAWFLKFFACFVLIIKQEPLLAFYLSKNNMPELCHKPCALLSIENELLSVYQTLVYQTPRWSLYRGLCIISSHIKRSFIYTVMFIEVGENRPFLEKFPFAFVSKKPKLLNFSLSEIVFLRKLKRLARFHLKPPQMVILMWLLPQHSLEW